MSLTDRQADDDDRRTRRTNSATVSSVSTVG